MGLFTKRSASVSKDDRFFFPAVLKKIPVNEKIIILSPETANWLVVEEDDLALIDRLVAGERVGSIMSSVETTNSPTRLKALLAQITARNFASIKQAPLPQVDPSLKGAYIYLTNACNLSCSHCYMYSGKANADELSISEWLEVVGDFSDCGGMSITFSGGEVLAKRGWFRVVEYAYKKNISSTILTNGTLWSPESIASVAPYIAEVQVSLDGPSEEINAKTRGVGSYQKAINTAKGFAAAGARTSIAMTPTLETLHLFEEEFQSFFEEHIVGTGINIRISHKLLSGRDVNALTGENKESYEATARRLANIIYPSSQQRTFSLGHQPNQVHLNCGFGGASISSNGDVFPCNRTGDVCSVGNVRVNKLGELIPLLKKAEFATNVDSITPCKWCDLRYICGGGCRIDDYYIRGSDGEKLPFSKSGAAPNSVTKDSCSEDYRLSLLRQMAGLRDYQFATNG